MTDPETTAYNKANDEAARIATERCGECAEPLGIGAMAQPPQTVLDVQVGGDCYLGHTMGPGEWCQRHRMNHYESNITKRAFRHNRPGGGGALDIEKGIDEFEKILWQEYGKRREPDQCPIP